MAHPEMANLPDIFVALKINSSEYQPYACGLIFRAPRSRPNFPISGWGDRSARTEYVLILAGDHLYDMDYRAFVEYHVETGADITMAVQPVSADVGPGTGHPQARQCRKDRKLHRKARTCELAGLESAPGSDEPYLASMGIYVFRTDLLSEVLKSEGDDFGKNIIPGAISDHRVMGYVYDGYWADIGTIRAFYEVNLEMALPERSFDFYMPGRPVYSRPRFLPASEVHGSQLHHTLLADGCRVTKADIS
jgi:glucose-1-phosphate adenylyltransferase